MKTQTKKMIAFVLVMVTIFCAACLTSCGNTTEGLGNITKESGNITKESESTTKKAENTAKESENTTKEFGNTTKESEKTSESNETAEGTIVIGLSGPLTGEVASYGLGVQNAANMAVEEINAKGGLFGKIKFRLESMDDKAEPSQVATTYSALLNKGMQISLGCVTSGACAEFAKAAKGDGVFFLTPSASNDDIPKGSNAYQMCFADGNQGAASAEYVNANYTGKTIGILYCAGDNYSEGIYSQFKDKLDQSITVVEASFSKDATDFSSQVSILKDCEFVFMPIYYGPASKFMIEAKKHENSMKIFYGCDALSGIDTIEGFDTIPQEISYLSEFDANSSEEATKTFVESYKAKFNGETPSQFAAAAYDCVYALYEALNAAGESKVSASMSAEQFCQVLKEQFDGSFTYSGVTGSNMKWTRSTSGAGYVEKTATKFVVKEADNA